MRKGLTTPLSQASLHTKSVVSLAYSEKYNTLISSALDNRVKMLVLDGGEIHCINTKKFDDPVTCVSLHPESKEFAVGCTSGALKVFKLKENTPTSEQQALEEAGLVERKLTKDEILQKKMGTIQQNLSTFQYGKAMKSALYARNTDVLMSTIEELLRRGTLHVALSNQNDRSIVQIVRFATLHVDKPQFTDTMMAVFDVITNIYGPVVSTSSFLHRELLIAQRKIAESIAVLNQMERSMGIMELLLNSSNF
ncbi:U3 small nucleolar RNA-associated protein 15 [Angomonas deanei]|uniref:UTP15 C terminal, putative n=1 Tax=Angomonas deanei TaxID=59799 RepID=S9UJR0_9TRYP|nr:U3 small nucleolar RNA-associated protein 15 [Angomonas deanei]EPY38637.1 U3 small nucleolar RNA-associated protein 15 [Angomonas deanei]CAD2219100.1 UTP15 C terminal, putative [Angomonas deanei]|eukprot:EPY29153.1 U3 small nucleolar RNA-associated protein 15 [Angomonas deanei]